MGGNPPDYSRSTGNLSNQEIPERLVDDSHDIGRNHIERQLAQAPGERSQQDVFRELADVAAANGNFLPLGKFFEGLGQTERYEYFKRIPAIFSKLGPSHDIREKMALLDKVNAPSSSLTALRATVHQMEARERYDQMKEEGILKSLSDKEFAGVCRSIASNRVKQGFANVEDAGSESAKRAAAAEVARCAIAGGTMEASKEIGNLAPGIVRDEAAAELVLWLRRTGSADEAESWVKTIVDEKAKARLEVKK